MFSSYHPISGTDINYKTIVNQSGYKADVSSGSIDDVYNTVIADIQNEDAIFKAGDFIDIGSQYFGKKNKIEKVIYLYDNSDSTLDLSPTLNPSTDNASGELVDYSVTPPLTLQGGINFDPATGKATSDLTTPDFLPTQYKFTVRNPQNGELQETSIWITLLAKIQKLLVTSITKLM